MYKDIKSFKILNFNPVLLLQSQKSYRKNKLISILGNKCISESNIFNLVSFKFDPAEYIGYEAKFKSIEVYRTNIDSISTILPSNPNHIITINNNKLQNDCLIKSGNPIIYTYIDNKNLVQGITYKYKFKIIAVDSKFKVVQIAHVHSNNITTEYLPFNIEKQTISNLLDDIKLVDINANKRNKQNISEFDLSITCNNLDEPNLKKYKNSNINYKLISKKFIVKIISEGRVINSIEVSDIVDKQKISIKVNRLVRNQVYKLIVNMISSVTVNGDKYTSVLEQVSDNIKIPSLTNDDCKKLKSEVFFDNNNPLPLNISSKSNGCRELNQVERDAYCNQGREKTHIHFNNKCNEVKNDRWESKLTGDKNCYHNSNGDKIVCGDSDISQQRLKEWSYIPPYPSNIESYYTNDLGGLKSWCENRECKDDTLVSINDKFYSTKECPGLQTCQEKCSGEYTDLSSNYATRDRFDSKCIKSDEIFDEKATYNHNDIDYTSFKCSNPEDTTDIT